MKVSIFWFRRDLRLEDNTALLAAITQNKNVLPFFIFDEDIIDELPKNDARVNFIYNILKKINNTLIKNDSSLLIIKGKPEEVWKKIISSYNIKNVYINKDYEPYAIRRDEKIENLLSLNGIKLYKFKDQVIHEEFDILKDNGQPYTVFTPYKNKWLSQFNQLNITPKITYQNFLNKKHPFPDLNDIGLESATVKVKDFNLENILNYANTRNFPYLDSTSYLSPHLRFGTISIRQVINKLGNNDHVFLSELIWREFFMQILFHFPHVVTRNFRTIYDRIKWRNNDNEFEIWCKGETGYPIVDAGMKQLNQTGYMHNRVRMITASFLCKHLLIDWRRGESYFAKKLLDYELSSNNGNWQWVAGTGCDAAPYFRIFNPIEQLKKFDSNKLYINKWLPNFGTSNYPNPMVKHKFARTRALEAYKIGLNNNSH